MSTPTPLKKEHEEKAVGFLNYGPEESAIALPIHFGEPEVEYAAVRKTAALSDMPQRGLLRMSGEDHVAFLQNMLTQDISRSKPGEVLHSFLLNRQGHIEADLTLIRESDCTWIDLDIHNAETCREILEGFVFTEDVVIENVTQEYHHLCLHGPLGDVLLSELTEDETAKDAIRNMANRQALSAVIAGAEGRIYRDDVTGSKGFHLLLKTTDVLKVYRALRETGDANDSFAAGLPELGWSSFNVTRVEAGTPYFNIDFAADNLPNETGVLDDRVSFTKGCYLGQEIVARIHTQGNPKQILRGLKINNDDALPATGAEVSTDAEGAVIGAVTSSALSPLLSMTPIAFAMIKHSAAEIGSEVTVRAEGRQVRATVQELCFLPGK